MRSWSLPKGTGLACGGLSRRRVGLLDRRNSNQVHFVVNVGGWRQITHRSLQGFVAHPVLHGPYIEPPAQHSRGIGRTKGFQVKLCRVEFGAQSDGFAVIEHVLFTVSCRGWEHQLAVRAMRMLPKFFEEFHRGWNLSIL